MRINNNLMAMNTHRQMGVTAGAQSKSMEKLSSGYRINRAGDDAAGLSISEKMRGQIKGLSQASRNAQDGISLIQTAEGALNETHSILQRMRELTVQGANDTNDDGDRDAINTELTALKDEITRIGKATEFNGKNLLDGTLGSSVTLDAAQTVANGINGITVNGAGADTYTLNFVNNGGDTDITVTNTTGVSQTITAVADPGAGSSSNVSFDAFGINIEVNSGLNGGIGSTDGTTVDIAAAGVDLQIGANNAAEQKLNITIGNMKSDSLGIGGSGVNAAWSVDNVTVDTFANATESIDVIEKALTQVSTQRSQLGAAQNRLEHTISNLDTSSENLQASESRIRDVDMAKK